MMIEPSFLSSICGATKPISQWLASTLFSRILRNWPSSMPAIGPKYGLDAALQTRTSICPSWRMVSSTRCLSSSFDEMLAGIAIARPAQSVAPIAAATAAHASGLRDEITTFAPASAMRSPTALPMPRVEPVMTAVLPASENKDMACSSAIYDSICGRQRPRDVLERTALRCNAEPQRDRRGDQHQGRAERVAPADRDPLAGADEDAEEPRADDAAEGSAERI